MLLGRARGTGLSHCRRGQHRFQADRLTWCQPTVQDMRAATAAASDDQAQLWLGWLPESVVTEDKRAELLARRPGTGRRWSVEPGWLIAIDRVSGRLAGCAVLYEEHRVGGWLSPQFRGQGLGRELFLGIATFAHDHLGLATVTAGADTANTASVGALTSAGFSPTSGPPTHRLPNGHTGTAQWFRHDTDHPSTCR
jgi:RimJ/RimL family protein N-acetyltransferase